MAKTIKPRQPIVTQVKPRFDKESGDRLPNDCPVCGSQVFLRNQILDQLGMVMCGNGECGNVYNPLIFMLVDKAKDAMEAQEENVKDQKKKVDEKISDEEFAKLRDKNKDLLPS